MDITSRLYVEIHPVDTGRIPRPHPIEDAGFDPNYIYKVLGMYNPSETSECYFVLANPQRQIWFIPQRHLLAYKLLDSDDLFLPRQITDTVPTPAPLPPVSSLGTPGEVPGEGSAQRPLVSSNASPPARHPEEACRRRV